MEPLGGNETEWVTWQLTQVCNFLMEDNLLYYICLSWTSLQQTNELYIFKPKNRQTQGPTENLKENSIKNREEAVKVSHILWIR